MLKRTIKDSSVLDFLIDTLEKKAIADQIQGLDFSSFLKDSDFSFIEMALVSGKIPENFCLDLSDTECVSGFGTKSDVKFMMKLSHITS